MSIKIHQPTNCVILPITRNGRVYNFFLDTGCPVSFTAQPEEIEFITNEDLGLENSLRFNLGMPLFDISQLSEYLMVDLSGLLGLDFVALFENVKIDFINHEIDFNIPGFNPELEVSFLEGQGFESYLFADLSIGTPDNRVTGVIDTGAFQSISLDFTHEGYPKSEGSRFFAPHGENTLDFYAGVKVQASGIDFGKNVVGCPRNFPPAPFEFVMGLNILSQYECCFNMKERKLQLRNNPRTLLPGIDLTEDTYSTGLQLILRHGNLQVSNILPGFDTAPVRIGDCLELEGIDLNSPEAANQVLERMTSVGEAKEVRMKVREQNLILKTQPLFR